MPMGPRLKPSHTAAFAIATFVPWQSCLAQEDGVFVKSVFVKGDQCWLDVKEIVHRNSYAVTEDEKARLLYAVKYQTVGGSKNLTFHVDLAKGNDGEEGCRLSVTGLAPGKQTDHVIRFIATEVKKLQNKREKH